MLNVNIDASQGNYTARSHVVESPTYGEWIALDLEDYSGGGTKTAILALSIDLAKAIQASLTETLYGEEA